MDSTATGEVARPAAARTEVGFHIASGKSEPTQPMVISEESALETERTPMETLPDPVPKPPGRAPGEPIIIRRPPGPPRMEIPEIDGTPDEGDDPEIEKPPEIIPEKLPPSLPWDRAHRPPEGPSATARQAR
jgi:hypothetical protein